MCDSTLKKKGPGGFGAGMRSDGPNLGLWRVGKAWWSVIREDACDGSGRVEVDGTRVDD